MKNFKEIAEKCAAGELYGTIILNDGREFYSKYLSQYIFNGQIVEDFYTIGLAKYLFHVEQIINFIPDNMQKKIEIDIPEGKVPVMEQTEKGVVITWKEKAETYADVESQLKGLPIVDKYINVDKLKEGRSKNFYKKVEVLRKLTNIRNYFGGDKPTNSWVITIDSALRPYVINNPKPYRENCFIYFDTKEHAEQAIKMLGDELKYLFEPW
jgi:hypothetical protein